MKQAQPLLPQSNISPAITSPAGSRPLRSALMRSGAIAIAGLVLIHLGGCQKLSDARASLGDVTGSIRTEVPSDAPGLQRYLADWGGRYERKPEDKRIAMAYAAGLRVAQRQDQAVAVLQKTAIKNPEDLEILAAYGKALADSGRLQEAAQVLEKSHLPEKPNWSVYSAQGSVADQMGNHHTAQQFYAEALKLAPGEPSVLSNLGLSYALSRQLPQGEQVLREATQNPRADRRVRQNLALVLALQGKFGEAEDVLRQVLGPADAAANIASIRSMIAQSNTWREIQSLDRQPARRGAKPTTRG